MVLRGICERVAADTLEVQKALMELMLTCSQ